MKEKRYTAASLRRAAERYFQSISRFVPLTETVDTGARDEKGRPVTAAAPVKNCLGEPVTVREFLLPPNLPDLCQSLGISRRTWQEYADESRDPALAAVTREIRERMEAWSVRQLLTRPGKDLKGILCSLERGGIWPESAALITRGDPLAGLDLAGRIALLSDTGGGWEETEDGDE